jgi:hypothetical protein
MNSHSNHRAPFRIRKRKGRKAITLRPISLLVGINVACNYLLAVACRLTD